MDVESATDCAGDAGQHDPTRSLGAVLDCGDQQKRRYKGCNVVERCFNKLNSGVA